MIRLAFAALVVAVIGAIVILQDGCAGSDPRAGLYGAEWARCTVDNDAAAEARACMRAVNRIYGQDGGVR